MDNARNVSLEEAMQRIGISRPTLWRMRRDGKIRVVTPFKRPMVPLSEVLRLTGVSTDSLESKGETVGEPVREPVKLRVKKVKLEPMLR